MNFEKLRLTGLPIRASFYIAVLFIPSFNVLSRYVNLVAVTQLFSSGKFTLVSFFPVLIGKWYLSM